MHKTHLGLSAILGSCCLLPCIAGADQRTDLFLTADFIYWTATEEGLTYASSGFSTVGNITHKGKVHTPDFGYHPGFKVGAGLNMAHDGWDIYANYTWLRTGNRHSSVATSGDLYPLWATVASDFTATAFDGNASWKLNFNVVDLELGKNFCASPNLILRPNFGLKGSWQQQHFYIDLTNFVNGDIKKLKERFRQHYLGMGIRGGLDTSWQFSKNWGIYGDLALSGMWSRFNRTRKETEESDSIEFIYINSKDISHTITPVLELGLGLKWDRWFSEECLHLGIQAGWEQQVWWNMNQFLGEHDRGPHGNLIMQGLTLEAQFDF